MVNEKRLTWKRSLDGFEAVGLREGITVGDAIRKLADLEERETVEVIHARWIDAREYCGDYMCSNCDALYGTNKFNYCPNCGANMEGESKHD